MKNKAFTLVELLVVIVLMAIIAGMTVPAFIGMGRGVAMRGEIASIRAKLSLCRQWAIVHREKVTFYWFIDSETNSSYYYIANEFGTVIEKTNEISRDVIFIISGADKDSIIFTSTGGLTPEVDKSIMIADRKRNDNIKTISVNGLTGGLTVK